MGGWIDRKRDRWWWWHRQTDRGSPQDRRVRKDLFKGLIFEQRPGWRTKTRGFFMCFFKVQCGESPGKAENRSRLHVIRATRQTYSQCYTEWGTLRTFPLGSGSHMGPVSLFILSQYLTHREETHELRKRNQSDTNRNRKKKSLFLFAQDTILLKRS